MPMKIRDMTENEREQLQKQAACEDAGVARRAKTVLMTAEGAGSQSIAQSLGISERTVRYAVKAFNDGGPEALEHRAVPGRPLSVTEEQRDALIALMRRSPTELGMQAGRWSPADLIVAANNEAILRDVSHSTIRREIARLINLDPELRERVNTPDQKQPGAPLGNRNAFKHGAYADDELSPDEHALVADMEARLKRDFPKSDKDTVSRIRAAAEACLMLNRALNADCMEAAMRADRKFRKAVKGLKTKGKLRSEKPKGTPAEWAANLLKGHGRR